MKLYNILKPGFIKPGCTSKTVEGIVKELLGLPGFRDKIPDEGAVLKKLLEREKQGATSMGNHSAVLHARVKDLKEPVMAIGISPGGFPYNPADKEPVHLFILILSPDTAPIIHLQVLAAAASLIKKDGGLIKEILAARGPEEATGIIRKYEGPDD